jgi:hypothetical protein
MSSPEQTQTRQTLAPLLRLVSDQLPNLSHADRADIYEALDLLLAEIAPDVAIAAARSAKLIRDAEAEQLLFTALVVKPDAA